jgi:hypothetical protein
MALNKVEQQRLVSLRRQIRLARAWNRTQPVEPDVPIPDSGGVLAKGWSFNSYTDRVEVSCSSSISHSTGRNDRTTTQKPIRQYSSESRALRALRYQVELLSAKRLADIDARIEKAEAGEALTTAAQDSEE